MVRRMFALTMVGALAGLALPLWPTAARAVEQPAAQAAPRENLMKVCGDRWRSVRETESANGVTWPQYLARCRAQAAAPLEREPAAPAASAASQSTVARAAQEPVFPRAVDPRHASERPALARQRTCADQFRANRTTQANGGLRWIEQGGGYWSRCNAYLKQGRA